MFRAYLPDPYCYVVPIECEHCIHYSSSWGIDKVTLLLLPQMTTLHRHFWRFAWNPALLLPSPKSPKLSLWFPEVILLRAYKTHPFQWPCSMSHVLPLWLWPPAPWRSLAFIVFSAWGLLLKGLFLNIPKTSTPQHTREALRSACLWGQEQSPQLCAVVPLSQKHNSLDQKSHKASHLSRAFSFSPLLFNTWSHPNSSKTFPLP